MENLCAWWNEKLRRSSRQISVEQREIYVYIIYNTYHVYMSTVARTGREAKKEHYRFIMIKLNGGEERAYL